MTERTRDFLKPEFRDGERPSGADFADLIDSFVNKATDGVSLDTDGNLVLSRGVRLGNSAGTAAGGLRFSAGQVQFFNGTQWVSLSTGAGGAFQPVGAPSTAVSFGTGNVGIGAFTAAAPPTYKLQVTLLANSGTGEQVRFGNAVCANGAAASGGYAMFAHFSHATNNNFALRQSPNGGVDINAASNQAVSIRQNGTVVRMGVSANGNVIIGSDNDLVNSTTVLVPPTPVPLLQVAGEAFKNTGSSAWQIASDARLKEDVRDLEAGLAQLRRVRPVRFRYNGRAGTPAGLAGVGVLGQEIETVFPEMVRRVSLGAGDAAQDDLRIFDGSALTFVLVNAVKELAAKVDQLELALAAAKKPARSRRTVS
jgi:hypothetical protein